LRLSWFVSAAAGILGLANYHESMGLEAAHPGRAGANPSKRILLATVGSLGDLHPCLALARELKRRGHRPSIATTPYYRSRVEENGIAFVSMRPAWDPTDPELIGQCADLKRGPEVLYRRMILPCLRETYDDLLAAAAQADLMLAGELVYAAPLVAEKLALPWVSIILSPFSFFSAHDPSIMVNAPRLVHLRKAGRLAYRAGIGLGRLATRHWSNPVRELRREEGLRRECDPVFVDKFSPHLVLALFSAQLARKQPDWPRQTLQPGFVFFDSPAGNGFDARALQAFLGSGDAPLVFTQGSTAVHVPGEFYTQSVEAARRLGRRAVLLGAQDAPGSGSSGAAHPGVFALPYAPYSQIFPHAAAIVHQGGSGTTGQAMHAGRPQLIVPYGWDQPDNGARVARLGAGLCLARSAYTAGSAAAALERLLLEARFAARAAEVSARLHKEDGLTEACDAVEAVFEAPAGLGFGAGKGSPEAVRNRRSA
jgi:UDP:flavonoid glycosyltransferase YjiC (YdhE family)